MRDEIANLVYPVFNYGLQLKERLDRGDSPNLEQEQATLKGLLMSENESRRWADFGSEGPVGDASVISGGREGTRRDQFLGIRYALVCWLDEIFIDSPWVVEWNERKLEVTLYGTNDRAWKFWDQARRAEGRAGGDALEVFFLCVMLGFRGDLREDAERLRAWVDTTQIRISQHQGQEWPVPSEQETQTFVPPRHGREKFQRMVLTGAGVLLVLIPVLAFVVVHKLVQ